MSSIADDAFSDLLEGRVKHKSNKAKNRQRAKKLVKYAPEVLIKISGNTKGADHMTAHLDYISRNGEIELEDEAGDILKGKGQVRGLAKEWALDQGRNRKNTRVTTNIVLSMPAGTQPVDVKDAARAFAKRQFGKNYQYVMALHTDTESPHVHLTVKNLGFDGKRLHIKKGDPQQWREMFADELEKLGVEAEATPRAARGVIMKGISQAIKHMRARGETPAVDRAKIKEIVESFSDDQSSRPWESSIKNKQTLVRRGWLAAAKDLSQSSSSEDKQLSKDIVSFVNAMPPLKTERHELKERLAEHMNAGAIQTQDEEIER